MRTIKMKKKLIKNIKIVPKDKMIGHITDGNTIKHSWSMINKIVQLLNQSRLYNYFYRFGLNLVIEDIVIYYDIFQVFK